MKEVEVDLLVAGAGAAGMTAALVGSLEGLRVAVCEKSSQVGGTSATAAGTLWIPGNTQSRRARFDDSAEKAQTYLDALLEGPEPRALRAAFLETGPKAIDYLEAKTEVKFLPTGRHPDYRELPGAAVAGRGLIPVPFDGRLLGAGFARVRAPIEEFMLLGGMMITKADIAPLLGRYRSFGNFACAARLVLRYGADRLRYPRGTRLTMGNALVARLYCSLRKLSVPVFFNGTIEELLRENGRVAAARVRADGQAILFKARKGVVLATGGFGQNRELRARYMPSPVPEHSMAHTDNTGDGLSLAAGIGAQIRPQRGGGLWTPASVTRRRDGSRGLYPHFLYDRAKPGLIAVNQAGRRFVNEGCSYHDFVEAMYASHKSVPSIPAWLVCEASFVAAYGLGAIHPGTRDLSAHIASGYITCASTLGELARALRIDAAGLEATIARHNEFVKSGVDRDFGKGSTELNRFNGDESLPGNPCLKPIRQPPFVAMAVWPADISVCTGLATDADARVLDIGGAPIPGLYACGNDMASVFAGHYPGPGTTLGPALTFGYRAAMHAAHAPS